MKATASALYPFVPAGPDFAHAIAIFNELGFDTIWRQEGLAGLRFGGAYFMLQDINIPEWQTNQMITFEVDDLEGYWAEIDGKSLPSRYAGIRLRPPTDFPWGREVHVIDPAGVCWHVSQAAALRPS